MNCPVCQRETSPVKIGGQVYCSVCGTAAPGETPAAPRRLSLDLSPRTRGNIHAVAARPHPATPHPGSQATPTPAAALHRRVNPSRVLDLRDAHAPAPTPKPQPITQPAHHEPAAPPKATAHERHLAHFNDRLEKAKQVDKSPHINKFAGTRLPDPTPTSAASVYEQPAHHEIPVPELPALAATHHAAMSRLVPTPPPDTPAPRPHRSGRPHLSLSPTHSRITATVAAILIMGGYVWLQNYPKLALQSADSKAGVAASLPGYLPSSYSLTRTDTSPGLVTLNFSSPSAIQALKIAQARTTWDSSSLLDNFVAKHSDDYATVQSQGLTIYLFNNNHATWVNKGIWFSIEGADRLSREQILRMAYSL